VSKKAIDYTSSQQASPSPAKDVLKSHMGKASPLIPYYQKSRNIVDPSMNDYFQIKENNSSINSSHVKRISHIRNEPDDYQNYDTNVHN
jgi:hypothetical protein